LSATQKLLRFGVFELNLDTLELRKSGTFLKLPPQPFKLLVLLASHAGQIVTREEIESQLWGEETHVDFEHGVNKCIKQIRTVLCDDADEPIYIETLPRQGYRFLAPVVSKTIAAPAPRVVESHSGEAPRIAALAGDGQTMPAAVLGAAAPNFSLAAKLAPPATATKTATAVIVPQPPQSIDESHSHSRRWGLWIGLAVLVLAVAFAGILFWRARSHPTLSEKDTVVLADFDNQTGDAVFDDALQQALRIQLEQSRFLVLISEARVNRTMRLMGRAADDPLSPEVAREVCLRTGSAAMITGSIMPNGSSYVIGLKALACNTGDVLAEVQKQAANREAILKALDAAASGLRSQLGESLSAVQKYAAPLSEVTTSSLEALKAYSQGRRMQTSQGDAAALPFYKKAVELDPNFAIALATLAVSYSNRNEIARAAENARKAYDLRDRVTERERFFIDAVYYSYATGELDKTARSYVLWQQTYPREMVAYANLVTFYDSLGNWDGAMEAAQHAMRLDPNNSTNVVNLGGVYTALNRFNEAEALYKQAQGRNLGSEFLLQSRYLLAFVMNDTAQMGPLFSAAMGVAGTEDLLLASQADTDAWFGRYASARELTKRAAESAQHNDAKETAAMYEAAAALREVQSGDAKQAIADAEAAMTLARNRDVLAMAALSLALAGDTKQTEKLLAELDRSFPLDTLVQSYWLPTIRAAVALQHKNPGQAIELLKATSRVELGLPTQVTVSLCPVYLRGEAYLALHDGMAAAAEFQKFIDHSGIVLNFPWGALARLSLARAYALQAETDPAAGMQARVAYQNFLTLSKNADPDIPIYQQAKAESAKLQ